ncbi:MAG: gamma-glutamylcyclotransferase family protein [Pseudomonadota bacterium]
MDATNNHSLNKTDPDELVAYFGYGSLANRKTLQTDFLHAQPVRLHGWRRCWRPRKEGDPIVADRPTSLLSARKVGEGFIDGLLVFDKRANLPDVDERERNYDRVPVPLDRIEGFDQGLPACEIFVYEAQTNVALHDPQHPILQSYLDVVLKGFLQEFGLAGVHHFLATTDGFERPVHTDRHRPFYPRSVQLTDEEQVLFDTLVDDHQSGMG